MQDFKGRQVRSGTGSVQPGPAQKPGSNARQPLTEPVQSAQITQDNILHRLESMAVDLTYYRSAFAFRWFDHNTLAKRFDEFKSAGLSNRSTAFAFSYLANRSSFQTIANDDHFERFLSVFSLLKQIKCDDETVEYCLEKLDCIRVRARLVQSGRLMGELSAKALIDRVSELIFLIGEKRTNELLVFIFEEDCMQRLLFNERGFVSLKPVLIAHADEEDAKKHPLYPQVFSLGFATRATVQILKAYPAQTLPSDLAGNIQFLQEKAEEYNLGKKAREFLGLAIVCSIGVNGVTSTLEKDKTCLEALCVKAQREECRTHPTYVLCLSRLGFSIENSIGILAALGADAESQDVKDTLVALIDGSREWSNRSKKQLKAMILDDPAILNSGNAGCKIAEVILGGSKQCQTVQENDAQEYAHLPETTRRELRMIDDAMLALNNLRPRGMEMSNWNRFLKSLGFKTDANHRADSHLDLFWPVNKGLMPVRSNRGVHISVGAPSCKEPLDTFEISASKKNILEFLESRKRQLLR